jgi:hypothetical protein
MRTDKDIINSLLLALARTYNSPDGLLPDAYIAKIISGSKDEDFIKCLANSHAKSKRVIPSWQIELLENNLKI